MIQRKGAITAPHPGPTLEPAWLDDAGHHYDRGDLVRVARAPRACGIGHDEAFTGSFYGVGSDAGGPFVVVTTAYGQRIVRPERVRPAKRRAT